MILADKLILLRKKSGLSQEELAYKLNVTRQSVSKWEGAQAMPEIDKIVEIGKLFNVSMDLLLNDNLQIDETSNVKFQERKTIRFSTAEAQSCINNANKSKLLFAIGVLLSILSFSGFIILFELSLHYPHVIGNFYAFIFGFAIFLVLFAAATALFLSVNNNENKLINIKKSCIELDSDAKHYVLNQKQNFNKTYFIFNLVGLILCILSLFPLIFGITGDIFPALTTKRITLLCYILFFILLAVGACLCAYVKHLDNVFNSLLQIENFSYAKIRLRTIKNLFLNIFYPIVIITFMILLLTLTKWYLSWLIWPVALLVNIIAFTIIQFAFNNKQKKHN